RALHTGGDHGVAGARADRAVRTDLELVDDVGDALDAGDRLLRRRLVGVGAHLARDQHDAVVARDVDVALVADGFANARAGLQLDRLVLDLRAAGAAVVEGHAGADRAGAHERDAA